MPPIFMTALFYLWVLFCCLQHCQNSVATLVKRGEKGKLSAGLIFKGVVSFFFFVKILIIRSGYTRMYLPYKNVYKRPFWSNIKALIRRENERV